MIAPTHPTGPASLRRIVEEASALVEQMRSTAERARHALHSADLDAAIAALEERERLQLPLGTLLGTLLGARDHASAADRATVEHLLAEVRARLEEVQADGIDLEVALIAGRQEIEGELERLDGASVRAGMYRSAAVAPGGSIDFRR